MNKDYCIEAANWWTSKIKKSEKSDNIHGLELFSKLLANKIHEISSIYGSLFISTYHSRSKLLDELADFSGLAANIPNGYQMNIFLNQVFVYDSVGRLIASF